MKLYIIKAYNKATRTRSTIYITDTEEKAEAYITATLTEYEKQKTNELRNKGSLPCNRVLFTTLFLLHNVRLY